MVSYYDYEELKNKALEKRDKQSRMDLLEWFQCFGSEYWNGEYYLIDNEHRLYPISSPIGEPDEDGDYEDFKITDAEIK